MKKIHYVGMDVHKETVSMAVVTTSGPEVIIEKTLPNEHGSLRRWFKKLTENGRVLTVYEAGAADTHFSAFSKGNYTYPA